MLRSPSPLPSFVPLLFALLLSNRLSLLINLSAPSHQFLISFLALTRFFLHVASTLKPALIPFIPISSFGIFSSFVAATLFFFFMS